MPLIRWKDAHLGVDRLFYAIPDPENASIARNAFGTLEISDGTIEVVYPTSVAGPAAIGDGGRIRFQAPLAALNKKAIDEDFVHEIDEQLRIVAESANARGNALTSEALEAVFAETSLHDRLNIALIDAGSIDKLPQYIAVAHERALHEHVQTRVDLDRLRAKRPNRYLRPRRHAEWEREFAMLETRVEDLDDKREKLSRLRSQVDSLVQLRQQIARQVQEDIAPILSLHAAVVEGKQSGHHRDDDPADFLAEDLGRANGYPKP